MKDLVNDLARGQLKLVVSMTERAATKYGFPSEAKPFQKFQDVNGDFWEFGLDSWWRKLSGDRGGSVSVLDEAATIIQGARNTDYGPPERNLTRIANLWTDYLETEITARQVAMMMILLKVSRDVTSPKRDNVVDIAGYAALADEGDTVTTLELTPAQTRMIAEQHHDSQQTEINKLKTRVEQLETTLARTVANLDSCEHDRDHFKREAVKLADVIAEVTRTVSSGLQTWGRVEDIPAHVAEFYDKEGDKWARDGYKYTCKLLSGPRSASFVNKYGPFTAKR